MIRYNKLFSLLALKGMKKTDLLEIISSPTLAKLAKGEVIKTDIIDRICIFLECQPSDIMEVYNIDFEEEQGSNRPVNTTYINTYNYQTGKTETEIIDRQYLDSDAEKILLARKQQGNS